MSDNRRKFLQAAALGIGSLQVVRVSCQGDDRKTQTNSSAEDVGAAEDLMREHGLLNRILLVYEEALRRLRNHEQVTPDMFHKPAALVRKFVEDYHEKLEEKFIFPEFERAKKLLDLVSILKTQHEAGRRVTDVILRNSSHDRFGKEDARTEIIHCCEAFIRMYRPHEAREDTVLFPTLHQVVSAERLSELGEQFEKEEDRLFGEEGFEKTVEEVATIEKQLGIYELAMFTAK